MEWWKNVARLWWVVTVWWVDRQNNMDDRRCGRYIYKYTRINAPMCDDDNLMASQECADTLKSNSQYSNRNKCFHYHRKKQKQQNIIESVHHSNSQEKLCLSYYLKTNKTNLSFSKVSHVLFLKVFRKPVLSSAFCGNEWCCSLESCTLLVTIHLIMQKCEGVGCFLWFLVMGTKDSQTAIPSIL